MTPPIPPGATLVDHPTARTLNDWRTIQREYEAEGYPTGLAHDPRTGQVLLWRGQPETDAGGA